MGQAPSRIPRYGITPGSRPWFLVRHLQSLVLVKQLFCVIHQLHPAI